MPVSLDCPLLIAPLVSLTFIYYDKNFKQCHQYQQKPAITSDLNWIHWIHVGNAGADLGQAQKKISKIK